jgi:hypothetical protein
MSCRGLLGLFEGHRARGLVQQMKAHGQKGDSKNLKVSGEEGADPHGAHLSYQLGHDAERLPRGLKCACSMLRSPIKGNTPKVGGSPTKVGGSRFLAGICSREDLLTQRSQMCSLRPRTYPNGGNLASHQEDNNTSKRSMSDAKELGRMITMMGRACFRTTRLGLAGESRAGGQFGQRSKWTVGVIAVILAAQGSVFAGVSQAATNPENQAKPSSLLAVEGPSLSVNLSKAPLAAVMEEFSKRSGIAVFVAPSVASAEVSVQFQQVPIEEGLKRILEGKRFVLLYKQAPSAGDRSGTRPLREILVLGVKTGSAAPLAQSQAAPRPEGASEGKVLEGASEGRKPKMDGLQGLLDKAHAGRDPEKPAETPSIEELTGRALEDSDPSARLSALDELASQSEGADLLPTYLSALRDENEEVRQAALQWLSQMTEGPPLDAYAEVALRDPSADLRGEALDLLRAADGSLPLAAMADVALKDSSPELRSEALEVMVEKLVSGQLPADSQPVVRASLERGLRDPDPEVREAAEALIEELKTPLRSR